jgi:uncharacterized protein (DUF4415 family)
MSERRTTGADKKKRQRPAAAGPRPYSRPHSTQRSVRESPVATGTDWHRLRAMTDSAAHRAAQYDSDNPPADAAWLAAGHLEVPARKRPISLRVDTDVLEWFKTSGPLYQTRMNDVLKAYVEFHTHQDKRDLPSRALSSVTGRVQSVAAASKPDRETQPSRVRKKHGGR